ncbi:hypothetical protein [Ectothiorhodospira shaposhnikovii]|uniref:hypothetical protein n=1 Tax=Ectothiorhodospira shaposhnikovii TaxID=1054 RepID=UPI001EE874FC|nr:hypothetical protein [Ectothiorhodospira shaposhnikovii]MCG5512875.1 hypothetical protein [Ectothiorhodospira shaposhnikovii]
MTQMTTHIPKITVQSTIHGKYTGAGLSTEVYDAIALGKINPRLFDEEKALFNSKWFDYRRMHPVEATYLFAACYSHAYAASSIKRTGKYSPGIRGSRDIFSGKSTNYQALWRARQQADRLGIPYPVFCDSGMAHAERLLWQRPPRPQHLCCDALQVGIIEGWLDAIKTSVRVPYDAWYRLDNFEGHPYQVAYQDWLCEQIKERRHQEYALATCIFMEKVLSVEVAAKHFPPEVVRRAVDLGCEM